MQAPALLRVWREGAGLTQQAAAGILNISQPTYSDYENGKKVPRTQKAIEVERATGGQVPVSAWALEDDDPAGDATAQPAPEATP